MNQRPGWGYDIVVNQQPFSHPARLSLLLASLASMSACGETDDGDGSGGASGVVGDEFPGACTLTFNTDIQVIDVFGDPAFTAQAGETYLMADELFGAETTASLWFLTAAGASDFEVELTEGDYETNCPSDATVDNSVGVFVDVAAYADAARTDEVCTLTRGQILNAPGYSFFAEGDGYEITVEGLSDLCGMSTVYVEAAEVRVGDTLAIQPPMGVILQPA